MYLLIHEHTHKKILTQEGVEEQCPMSVLMSKVKRCSIGSEKQEHSVHSRGVLLCHRLGGRQIREALCKEQSQGGDTREQCMVWLTHQSACWMEWRLFAPLSLVQLEHP